MKNAGRYIAVGTAQFPSVSQTFVRDHVERLLGQGWGVDVIAERPEADDENPPLAGVGNVYYTDPLKSRGTALAFALRHLHWPDPRGAALMARLSLASVSSSRQQMAWCLPMLRGAKRYSLVHCHFGHCALPLVPLFRLGVIRAPLVVTFHGFDLQGYLVDKPGDFYRPLFEQADSLVATGPYMKEVLLSLGAPAQRIVTVANGVRTADIEMSTRRPPGPGEPIRILTVARLVEKKGVRFGLEAIAALVKRGLAVRYHVVGAGPLREALLREAAALGIAEHVEFLGALPHAAVLTLCREAHLFLSPGIVATTGDVETQGVALLEAMASGLPIVASAVGGVIHTVPAGAGSLVRGGDAAALSQALKEMIERPETWARYGEFGRAHVVEHYDQARNFAKLLEIYAALWTARR